jgi:YrbI family 3-deoxy-D-manno-octulosonate 8-phosphate phosphatase
MADDESLRRLGTTTALAATWERVRQLTFVSECWVVTDSEAVREWAKASRVRCLEWQELGRPVTSVRAEESPASAWPPGTVASASVSPPPKGTELAVWSEALRVSSADSGGLWVGQRWDVLVFVDAACPLWEAADLRLVVDACEVGSRAFLATQPSTVWVSGEAQQVTELERPACVELSTLHAYRLTSHLPESPAPVVAASYKGWSVRDPVERLGIEAVWARHRQNERAMRLPQDVAALVMDFDGVLTDNRVVLNQEGVESVVCHRGDGLGLEMLRSAGVPLLVLSKEGNPVVRARCDKLKIPCLQGIDDKLPALRAWASERNFAPENLVYVGNDINDLECLKWVGCAVAVGDSHPEVLSVAHIVLDNDGGKGAIRELCEMILSRRGVRMPVTSE